MQEDTDGQITSWDDLASSYRDYIIANPSVFGGADILAYRYRDPFARAGLLCAVLCGLVDPRNRKGPAVRKFALILPPGAPADAHSRFWNQLKESTRHLTGRDLPPAAEEWLRGRVNMLTPQSLASRAILELLPQEPRTAVVVTCAASYRDPAITPFVSPERLHFRLSEDVWVPQLHSVATKAVAVAAQHDIYVAFDADESEPVRPENRDLLSSIGNCGITGVVCSNDLAHAIAPRDREWSNWLAEGRLGRILGAVAALDISHANKALLKIQVLQKAEQLPLALDAIREFLTSVQEIDGPAAVRLARIADEANASALAADLLESAIEKLNTVDDLELALVTAEDVRLNSTARKLAARLEAASPESPILRHYRRSTLRWQRDFKRLGEHYAIKEKNQERADFYTTLAHHFSGTATPDYRGLIATANGRRELADAFRIECVHDALERKLFSLAFELAYPPPNTKAHAKRGDDYLLRVLAKLLLHAPCGEENTALLEGMCDAVISLAERLSQDPTRNSIRFGLGELLAPASSGTTGLALIATAVLKLAARPAQPMFVPARREVTYVWLEARMASIKNAFAWLRSESPVLLAAPPLLPRELLPGPPEEFAAALQSMIERMPIENSEDTALVQNLLTIGLCTARHCPDTDCDLAMLRTAAAKLAVAGSSQLARDLVEQALIAGNTPRRRRLAWLAMADVYGRCRNQGQALIAIACAFAADRNCSSLDICDEQFLLARLLRDSNLPLYAFAAVRNARAKLAKLDISASYLHRLQTVELQVRLQSISGQERDQELRAILTDALENSRAILAARDETGPLAVLLGQLVRLARRGHLHIPDGADELLKELRERSRGVPGARLEMMSGDPLSVHDLLALAQQTGAARYSEDVGFDMHDVAIAASRSLTDDAFIVSGESVSLAIELMADRAIAAPDYDEAAVPPPPPAQVGVPAEIARELSSHGIAVLQAAFDEDGRLISVCTAEGTCADPVRDPAAGAEARLRKWARTYPYDLGLDESPNLFYTSTEGVALPQPPDAERILLATSVLMQSFPPNLLWLNGDFIGRGRPVASVPSLMWLRSAMTVNAVGNGKLVAWAPIATGDHTSRAIGMIAERLTPTFEEYGFALSTASAAPVSMASASIALVIAHGSVNGREGFFHAVSDDSGLRMTAADLAEALRNVAVAVLFVCSGGRVDRHPTAVTTLGLARRILDRGASAVIASPWPIDSQLPPHWLPVFMREWSAGEMIIDATFRANQAADRYFASDPARGLAMTLYGNPLLRHPGSQH